MALDAVNAPVLARRAAWDVMRYDQQGCYSPHIFYVQRGGQIAPREFAGYLAGELANLQRRFPRRALDLEESAAVAEWRQSIQWQLPAARPPGATAGLIRAPPATRKVGYHDDPLAPVTPACPPRRVVAGHNPPS